MKEGFSWPVYTGEVNEKRLTSRSLAVFISKTS